MCGIAGILDFSGEEIITRLNDMSEIIKHRGPDDEGFLLFNEREAMECFGNSSCEAVKQNPQVYDIYHCSKGKFPLGLLHRRLSILDLSAKGHQPMRDGYNTITFNGEIYNYLELRELLESQGHLFVTDTDTEVILKAYEEWGENCVKYFNGMWAFAIYDQKKETIFCSRDRLGAKPFYFYQSENKFIFSSELKQMIQDKKIERKIDEETLTISVLYGLTDFNEHTWIKSINMLRGGENLTVTFSFEQNKILDIKKYFFWDLENISDSKESSVKSEEQYSEIIGNELERSIKYRLRSDVDIGILLSGGLDSSAITALASKQLKSKKMPTFTACYENDDKNDERIYATAVNKYCGCKENLVFPEIENIEKEFEELVWCTEGLTYYTVLASSKVIEEAARKGIKVILNGQGGDETLFGYERYYAFLFRDLLRKGRIKTLIKELNSASENSKLTLKELFLYILYFNFSSLRSAKKRKEWAQFTSKEFWTLVNKKLVKSLLNVKDLKELQYLEIRKTQLPHILRWDDRLYMKSSIESRVPFIDYEYIEKAMQIPPQYKIQGGYTKKLLRDYIKGRLPDSVTWRKWKLGFSSPTERWTNQFSDHYIKEMTVNARSKKYFNLSEIQKLFKNNPNSRIIQTFLSVEIFMRKFNVEA